MAFSPSLPIFPLFRASKYFFVSTPTKTLTMDKKATQGPSSGNSSTLQKVLGILAMILYFMIWFIDRFIHLLLPHAPHKNLKQWALEPTSLRLTAVRIIIFIIPIIIYNLIF